MPGVLWILLAAAQAADPAPRVDPPRLLAAPSALEVERHYPEGPRSRGVEGLVQLRCRVSLAGQPVDCVTLHAAPEGEGFVPAAMRVAAAYRLVPQYVDGVPTDQGEVALNVRFAMSPPMPGATREPTPAELASALAPYREALERTRRPVHRVALEDFPEDTPTASKVGGRAWWPKGTPAPKGESGREMVLLAQINFAELPPTPGYPDAGLLQFLITPDDFYGASMDRGYSVEDFVQQRNFRVVYWPDTQVPATVLATVARDDDLLPHDPGKPRRMRFVPGTERVSSADYRYAQILGGDAYATLEAWAKAQGLSEDAVYQVMEQDGGGGHKIGGYPAFVQEDPRSGGPLELLLQLDTDGQMMWGDMGVGGFFIDPADLARRDFSRVMYTWDCH